MRFARLVRTEKGDWTAVLGIDRLPTLRIWKYERDARQELQWLGFEVL